MSLKKRPPRKLRLSAFTTIGIGGPARIDIADDLAALKTLAGAGKNNFYLLGAGSNILAVDAPLRRPVIKLGEGFSAVRRSGTLVEAGAGVLFSRLLDYCCRNGLGGLENLAGVPGTLGGMLACNASARKGAISDVLVDLDIFSGGRVTGVAKEKIKFAYRDSSLKGKIIIGARLRLREDRYAQERAADFIREKSAAQDYSRPSFGCVFKNPHGFSAGYLIDSCGLKGLRKNDAQISKRHANFIINLGKAKYRDVDYLIKRARAAVGKKFNIILEEEVVRWT